MNIVILDAAITCESLSYEIYQICYKYNNDFDNDVHGGNLFMVLTSYLLRDCEARFMKQCLYRPDHVLFISRITVFVMYIIWRAS
jgi:hypothetical protein